MSAKLSPEQLMAIELKRGRPLVSYKYSPDQPRESDGKFGSGDGGGGKSEADQHRATAPNVARNLSNRAADLGSKLDKRGTAQEATMNSLGEREVGRINKSVRRQARYADEEFGNPDSKLSRRIDQNAAAQHENAANIHERLAYHYDWRAEDAESKK
jgi:hypothetical protein